MSLSVVTGLHNLSTTFVDEVGNDSWIWGCSAAAVSQGNRNMTLDTTKHTWLRECVSYVSSNLAIFSNLIVWEFHFRFNIELGH